MSRSRFASILAIALLAPAVAGAQSLGGSDAPPPAFGAPTAEFHAPGSGFGPSDAEAARIGLVPEPSSVLLTATAAMAALVGYQRRRPRR